MNTTETTERTINEEVVLLIVKFAGSNLRQKNKYRAESISQTDADIKNLSHLIILVPFIVIFRVRLFKGFTRIINANNPIMNGKSTIMSPIFGSRPITLKSFGLA